MATSTPLKATASLLFFLLALTCASAARSLIDDTAVPTVSPPLSGVVQTPTTPATTVAGGSGASTAASAVVAGAGPATTTGRSSSVVAGAGAASTVSSSVVDPHALTFFMHDILGGSNPTARAVTGIVTNPALSAQVPFAKPNGANLPLNTGVPQNSNNNGLINNNNIPILPGLGGNTGNLVGNNNGNGNSFIGGNSGFPVLNGGQLPQGMTLQKLMFGTLTVFDDELTEGHELGSGLLGKAQGFYVASSEDGNSQTMALTAMFESGGYIDSISLFGVHRTVVSESQLAIMGGTGKYVNARGFAMVKALPVSGQSNTDGVETVLQFSVYLA